MAKKGQVFQSYTEEFKLRAVQCYLEGSTSYQALADKLGIRSCTQNPLKADRVKRDRVIVSLPAHQERIFYIRKYKKWSR